MSTGAAGITTTAIFGNGHLAAHYQHLAAIDLNFAATSHRHSPSRYEPPVVEKPAAPVFRGDRLESVERPSYKNRPTRIRPPVLVAREEASLAEWINCKVAGRLNQSVPSEKTPALHSAGVQPKSQYPRL